MQCPVHEENDYHVTSAQMRAVYASIIGTGSYIADFGEFLEPELAVNNTLKIKSGALIHHGDIVIVPPGTYDAVTYLNGTQAMKRIDLVVYRYTKLTDGTESGEWVVIQGTPTESEPEVPAHINMNMQNGDLADDCPIFELHFDGINVTEVRKLLGVEKSMSNKQDKVEEEIVAEARNITTTSNWYVVEAKKGYHLVEAYTFRDDTNYFVKGINRRTNYNYTVIFDGIAENTSVTLYLVWMKIKEG